MTGIVSILGERLESYSYDPSGQAMRATSTNRYQKTFYGYNAESYDPKTGSVYLRARYYNTRTGSFSTKDTYLGELDDPFSRNRYSYAKGNPINYLDTSGNSYAEVMEEAWELSQATGDPVFAIVMAIIGALIIADSCAGIADVTDGLSDWAATRETANQDPHPLTLLELRVSMTKKGDSAETVAEKESKKESR